MRATRLDEVTETLMADVAREGFDLGAGARGSPDRAIDALRAHIKTLLLSTLQGERDALLGVERLDASQPKEARTDA